MTKETKIGLLVGLAFIILFAVILSEKGAATNHKPPTQLTQADSSRPLDGTDPQQTIETGGRLPLRPDTAAPDKPENQPGGATVMIETPIESPVGQQIPGEGEPIPALPDTVVERLNLTEEDDEVPTQTANAVDGDTMTLNQAVQEALNPRIPEDSTASAAPTGSLPASEHTGDIAPATTPAKTVKVMAMHTVGKGESLSKIASRYYGRATRARIQAIFDANRDKLKSIDKVRSGMELAIPELTPVQSAMFEPAANFAPAEIRSAAADKRIDSIRIPVPLTEETGGNAPRVASSKSPAVKPVAPPKPQQITWYVVQENDTLTKIARRELGNEGRCNEIFKLNSDVLRDKHTLRPGVKIRLPRSADSALATSMVTE